MANVQKSLFENMQLQSEVHCVTKIKQHVPVCVSGIRFFSPVMFGSPVTDAVNAHMRNKALRTLMMNRVDPLLLFCRI